ncbi:ribonuclease H-like domain-containing protein [Calycina marina]|uniref:Ribonuclease H-like domain-containing protein n=1 Tax=Calycina marina TaxID=1763456 RepID=A0A9P7Z825_9HELO|nr:ribonuclease H-like domain-containing protein [Calycina marina]
MEVDQHDFKGRLLDILINISNASFISFDLEMSGIDKRTQQQKADRRNGGKPTLQEQYGEMRAAAEAFQILQFGICCVEEDHARGFYLARPYNFNLSPLEADIKHPMFHMDRNLQFSGEACKFLASVKFDFGKVFKLGVTYLSRREENDIKATKTPGLKQQQSKHIILNPGSEELGFYYSVRDQVLNWIEKPDGDNFLNIDHPKGNEHDLNGLQRKLIHQLLEAEFPEYEAKGKEWMQITKANAEYKTTRDARDLERFQDKLSTQIGLRWVVEALVSGDLEGLTADWFYSDVCHMRSSDNDKEAVEAKLALVKQKLKVKKHIVVGHNLFMDLGFLYATFIGPLPQKVADFQKAIHEILPVVMDTKYIDSAGQTAMSSKMMLKDLLREYKKLEAPPIYLHGQHSNYNGCEKQHEAGYDAWMTAELFVKLVLKLYKSSGQQDKDLVFATHDLMSPKQNEGDPIDLWGSPDFGIDMPAGYANKLMQQADEYSEPSSSSVKSSPVKLKQKSDILPITIPVATSNPFAVLAAEQQQDQSGDDSSLFGSPQKGNGKNGSRTANEAFGKTKTKEIQDDPRRWLPNLQSLFWSSFVNKLRVNAADSGICDLASD